MGLYKDTGKKMETTIVGYIGVLMGLEFCPSESEVLPGSKPCSKGVSNTGFRV